MRLNIVPLFLIGTVFSILCSGCRNNNSTEKRFIISRDSASIFFDCYRRNDTDCLKKLKYPYPPLPPGMDWYSKLVFIFDSTDRVYLYQTEITENHIRNNTSYSHTGFPNFIGLKPQNLIAFRSDQFIDFIKLNNDILNLDSSRVNWNRFVYLASNMDTVLNPAFYELKKMFDNEPFTGRRSSYLVRKTTEEENNVIYCKRRSVNYTTQNFKWSANFIDGKHYPLTKEYDSAEKKLEYIIKAKETLKEDCTRLPGIM